MEGLRYITSGEFVIPCGGVYPASKDRYGELAVVVEGEVVICEGWCEYTVKAGQALLTACGGRRYGSRPQKSPAKAIRIVYAGEPSSAGLAGDSEKLYEPASFARFMTLCDMLGAYSGMPEYPGEGLDLLLRLIFTELFVYGLRSGTAGASALCEKIREVVTGSDGNIKVSQAAQTLGHSPDYLTRVFKSFYTKGLKAYIDDVRLARIKSLLGTGAAADDAARETGFPSSAAMKRFIRRHK